MRLRVTIILIAVLGFASCDLGNTLFTDDEIGSMYTITFSQDMAPIASGARLSLSKPLGTSVSGMDGAPDATSLLLRLLKTDGEEVASITFSTATNPEEGVIRVKNFSNDIPPFTLPELGNGYYLVEATLRNTAGAPLSNNTTAILIFDTTIPQSALAVYPGRVIPNEVSLLRLEGSFPEGLDPWIRWSIDGSVKAVGSVSELNDRLAWRAPKANGVYLVKAEIFPFQPPAGHAVAPLSKVEARLIPSSELATLDSIQPLSVWSRLSFDGDFSVGGSMSGTTNPVVIGIPYLETYPTGFGYLMGDGNGVQSSSSLLPTSKETGLLAPFSVQLMLAPAPNTQGRGSGTLLTTTGQNGEPGIVIGIENGYPFIAAGSSRITASQALRSGATRLAIYVAPQGNKASVAFYIDEQAAGRGILDSDLFSSRPGACTIAGIGGYLAIYDELRILEGPYPAFLLSETASKSESLLTASGFEGGHIDRGMSLEGLARVSNGSLSLPSDSSLFIDDLRLSSQGVTLSYELISGTAAVSLNLDDDSRLLIDSNGHVSLGAASAPAPLLLSLPETSRVSVSIESSKDGLRVYGTDGGWVLIPLQASDESRLSIVSVGAAAASLSNVSVSILKTMLVSSGTMQTLSTPGSDTDQTLDASNTIKLESTRDQD